VAAAAAAEEGDAAIRESMRLVLLLVGK